MTEHTILCSSVLTKLDVELDVAASARDLTSASTSKAAFFRLSYDRSPSARCTSGGRGDSTDNAPGFMTLDVFVALDKIVVVSPMVALEGEVTLEFLAGGGGGFTAVVVAFGWGWGLGWGLEAVVDVETAGPEVWTFGR